MQRKSVFQQKILAWYRKHARHNLPWRRTRNPYRILVSEIMLQQTQVPRVVEKYKEFLKIFPTIRALAGAPPKEVLRVWKGLGYNRRALYLRRTADIIEREHKGVVPRSIAELEDLPGIGKYTARAILVFAWDQREVFIETNIRRVYLKYFFDGRDDVTDRELLPIIERTLPEKDYRAWYFALMDYGSSALKGEENPNHRSKHYVRQARFEGSRRYVRAVLLDSAVKSKKGITISSIQKLSTHDKYVRERAKEIPSILHDMQKDGLLEFYHNRWRVVS
ncbi:MAG: A/G-specific adenine glycosylase [Patescibacteria group bacterium]